MRETAILRTLNELDRWTRRREELRAQLARLGLRDDDARRELREELAKIERQASYYEALTQDMKRSVRPAGVGDLLRTFFRA